MKLIFLLPTGLNGSLDGVLQVLFPAASKIPPRGIYFPSGGGPAELILSEADIQAINGGQISVAPVVDPANSLFILKMPKPGTTAVKDTHVGLPLAKVQPFALLPPKPLPVASNPAASNPVASNPAASNPATSTPTASTPTASTPMASTPTTSTPTASTPTASTPTASTPTASTPVTSAPVEAEESEEMVTRSALEAERKREEALVAKKALMDSRWALVGSIGALLFFAGVLYLFLNSPSNSVTNEGGALGLIPGSVSKGTTVMFVSAIFSAFFAYANRRDNHQLGDVFWTGLAFILFTVSGFFEYKVSDNFGRLGVPALILLAGLFMTYIPAFDRGLDLSTAGTKWSLIVWVGATFGVLGPLGILLGITDYTVVPLRGYFAGEYSGVDPKFTYTLFFLLLWSGFHFVFDIWGPTVKSRKPFEWLVSLGFTAMLLLAYFGIPAVVSALNKPMPDPVWVLAVSMALLGIIAMPRKDRNVIEGDGSWRDVANNIITGSHLDGLSLAAVIIVARILIG